MVETYASLSSLAEMMLDNARSEAAAIGREIAQVQQQIAEIDHQSNRAMSVGCSAFAQSRLGVGALWQLHLSRRRLMLVSAISTLQARQELQRSVLSDAFGKKAVLDSLVQEDADFQKRKVTNKATQIVQEMAVFQKLRDDRPELS